MKILNSLNYNHNDHVGEINKMVSMTIPDQTMTVREILERHSRGLTIDSLKVPIYDEGDQLPDIRKMDLADREQFAEYAKEEIKRIKSKKASASEQIINEERIDV